MAMTGELKKEAGRPRLPSAVTGEVFQRAAGRAAQHPATPAGLK
ncbi:hypothetical protein [Paracoccus binzhouensis]|nr:hypothetical protein [Paracoccus binzhouensis]